MNGLPVAADDPTDIRLAELNFEYCHLAAWKFRQDHVIGKFHQLADDKLEKLFHDGKEAKHEFHESTRKFLDPRRAKRVNW